MTTRASVIPEQGQLVRVRGRMWVASEVNVSDQPHDALSRNSSVRHHVVTLTSIEDEALGDELKVVWEVEPGTRVLPDVALPDPRETGFDDPDRLDAFLDAVRWGALTNADSKAMQSPFRAGIEIEDYQLAPLVRALAMPRVNLLIADDVGLGKTIEAGLIVQELILRHRAHTVMVVCPPSLCAKWQREMHERFGLWFEILDSDRVKVLRRQRGPAVNPFALFPRMIASIDWIKLAPQQALLGETLHPDPNTYPRRFDLLIVDEAHQCAPPAAGRYAVDSLRTKAIRRLAPQFEHRLFLTATPHNGYPESFQALLELLDPQRFARGVRPSDEQQRQVMIRRLKMELREILPPGPDGRPRFAERKVIDLPVTLTDAEERMLETLEEYTELRRRAATSEAAGKFVTLLLKKRFLSSPAAFHTTLQTHIETLHRARRAGRTSERTLQEIFDRVGEDFADEAELEEATAEALAAAAAHSGTLSTYEEELLARMRAWAESNKGRADSKATRLLEWIEEVCRPEGEWNTERVVIFTEYRDTLNYLHDLMVAKGWVEEGRVAVIHGGMDSAERNRINEEFLYDPEVTAVRVLLATDAASEGIDLHEHCHRLVHVEIPFSPIRLEQRNGRIDRHGQRAPEVLIHHFVAYGQDGKPAGDTEFLARVAHKLQEIRHDLGSAAPVLARQIEERMIGTRRDLDEREWRDDTKAGRLALQQGKRIRDEIEELRARLESSVEEVAATPERLLRVVQVALDLARQQPLRPTTRTVEGSQIQVWEVPDLTGPWADATIGLADPITDERRPITFDGELVARTRTKQAVHVHLGHPLVAKALRLLRAQVWAPAADTRLARVTARVAEVEDIVVVAHTRLVITGTDGQRLHEEIVPAGVRYRDGRASQITAQRDVQAALDAATDEPVPKHVLDLLAAQWPRIEESLRGAIENRARTVAEQKGRHLDARRDEQLEMVRQVLTELRTSILESLEEPEWEQLVLDLDGDQRNQVQRDLEALRRRAEAIPEEIEREQELIRRRYAERTPRWFPAAVTFLVPREVAQR